MKGDSFRSHQAGRGLFRTSLLMCLALVIGACDRSASVVRREGAAALSDEAKRAAIETMYADYKRSFPEVPDITPDRLAAMQAEGDVVIVDVREPEERSVSMIPGAISKEAFEQAIERYKDSTIVAHCTVGYRSGKYAGKLRKKGLEVFNLKGTILAWVHAGKDVVDADGRKTRKVHVYDEEWNLLPEGYEALW